MDPNAAIVALPTTKKKEIKALKVLILVMLGVYSVLLMMPVWMQLGGRDPSWDMVILNTAWVAALHMLLIPSQTHAHFFTCTTSRTDISPIHRVDRVLFYALTTVVGVGMWFALIRTAAVFFADYTKSTDVIFVTSLLIALACATIHYVRTMFMGAPLVLTLVWVIFTSTTVSTNKSDPNSSTSASSSNSKLAYTISATSAVLLIVGIVMLYIVAKGLMRAAKQKMANAYVTIASAYVFALVPFAFWSPSGDAWLSQYAYARGKDYIKVYSVVAAYIVAKAWNHYGFEHVYSNTQGDSADDFATAAAASWCWCCCSGTRRSRSRDPEHASLLADDEEAVGAKEQ